MLAQIGNLTWSAPFAVETIKNIHLSYSVEGVPHEFDLPPTDTFHELELPANSITPVALWSIGVNGIASQKIQIVINIGDLVDPDAPPYPRDPAWTPTVVVRRPDPVSE
jgi:hypothetical protein